MDGRNAQATGDLLRPRYRIMMWYGNVNGRVVLIVYCAVLGTTEQVSHRRGDIGAVVLATKIRLENGNDQAHNGEEKNNDCRKKEEEITELETRNGGNKK